MEVSRTHGHSPLTPAPSPEGEPTLGALGAEDGGSCGLAPLSGSAEAAGAGVALELWARDVPLHVREEHRAELARRAGMAGHTAPQAALEAIAPAIPTEPPPEASLGARVLAERLSARPAWGEQAMGQARDDTPIWFMPTTSTFLVDDSPSFLQSAARFLAADERIEIIGVALSAEEALEQVATLKPDLVLMDLNMPGMNGLEATRLLKAGPSPPRVVILTLNDTEEYRQAALQAQADGFVAKSDLGQKLLPLLESLLLSAADPASPLASPPSPLASPPSAAPMPDVAPATPDASPGASASTYSATPRADASAWRVARSGPAFLAGPPADGLALGRGEAASRHVFPLPLLADGHRSLFEDRGEASASERPRVLLAEDQARASHLMAVNMWRAGIETRIAPDALSALELFEIFEPHLVLLDAASAHMRAGAVCRSIRERSDVPILLLTARANGAASGRVAPGLALLRQMANIEEAPAPLEDVHGLTARVLALLGRFYPDA